MILASYIRPFDAKQKIYVLTDGKRDTEEIRLTSLEGFSDTVMQLIQEYGVTKLELHGNFNVCLKQKERIAEAEMTKYHNNQLEITLEGV